LPSIPAVTKRKRRSDVVVERMMIIGNRTEVMRRKRSEDAADRRMIVEDVVTVMKRTMAACQRKTRGIVHLAGATRMPPSSTR
jgi:hypothetical protein